MMVCTDAILEEIFVPNTDHRAGWIIDMEKLSSSNPVKREYFESFFIVDFIPTSENLSKWVYDLATPKMAILDVEVGEVEWWETPKSCSRYSG